MNKTEKREGNGGNCLYNAEPFAQRHQQWMKTTEGKKKENKNKCGEEEEEGDEEEKDKERKKQRWQKR